MLQVKNGKNFLAIGISISVLVAGYLLFLHKSSIPGDHDIRRLTDHSIAVLPFINRANATGQEYIGDGLSEGILNSLAQVEGLKVSGRFSSFQFRGPGIDPGEAGKKLGVTNLLEGSYQVMGNRIHITAQLIDAKEGAHFWSAEFEEDINDIFNLQDKIAYAVTRKLEVGSPGNPGLLKAEKPVASATYSLYLQGRALWNQRSPSSLKKAINFFNQAIAEDSSFARAYSGIADCYTALGYGSHLSPGESFPMAMQAAVKALRLDSSLAEPHASLAFYQFYYEWDWAAAEEEFRKAIALNHNYEVAWDYYGYYLTAMKRYDEAIVVLTRAAQLDPLSLPINTDIGFSLYYSKNYDTAIARLQLEVQKNPQFLLANLWLGRAYQATENFPAAIGAYQKALQISVNWPVALAALGNAYGVSGDKVSAKKVLDTLRSLSSSRFVTAYGVALVYAGLEQNDLAFEWLTKAIQERSNWLVWLKTDPRWNSIRSDLQFAKLVSAIGLPQ